MDYCWCVPAEPDTGSGLRIMSSRGGKKKSTKTSRSTKAGVIFPVGRMLRYIKRGLPKYRIGVGAPVYLAAVLEYLTGELTTMYLIQVVLGICCFREYWTATVTESCVSAEILWQMLRNLSAVVTLLYFMSVQKLPNDYCNILLQTFESFFSLGGSETFLNVTNIQIWLLQILYI